MKGLVDWLKGKFNDADDSMSANPTVIRQRIRQTKADLDEIEVQLTEQHAEQRQLKADLDKCENDIARYQDGAKKALAANDEGLAREALEAKQKQAVRLAQLQQKLQIINNLVETLAAAKNGIQKIKDDCELQLSTLESSQELTKMAESAAQLANRYGSGSSVDLGEVTRDQNVKLDAAMERLSQVAHANKGVDSKLAELGAGSGIDAELQALRAEMNQQ